MSTDYQSMDVPSLPLPQRRSYFGDGRDSVDGMKYRLGTEDIIQKVGDKLRGVARDRNGRIIELPNGESFRQMNDIGIYNMEMILDACISKTTHLSNFHDHEMIFKQMRVLSAALAKEIMVHRKEWEIKNPSFVQQIIEKTMFESMLRANQGFENNNLSKSWNVNESIDRNPPQEGGGLFGMFTRRRQ